MTAIALPRPALRARLRQVLGWYALSRLVTLAAFAVDFALGPRGRLGPRFFTEPFRVLGSWDGEWYRRVAENGYLLVPGRASDPAFFPLYPILLRLGHELTSLPFTVVGVVISNLALLVGLAAFYELGRRVVDDDVALRATAYAAFAPLAFVYSMVYPESVLLALGCLGLLAALARRWLLAAVLVAAAALAREEALVFVLPLAATAWSQRHTLDSAGRGRALAAVLAAPAALLGYVLYLKWALDDARAWSTSERAWGRAFSLDGPGRALVHLPRDFGRHPALFARDLVLLLVALALLAVAARAGVPRAWLASGAAVVCLPLFSGTVESEGRFALIAFPVYWGLASVARTRRRHALVTAVSAASLVAGVLALPYVWP